MADKERSFLFDLLSTQSVIAGVVLLVMCWLVLRYITTGRKRRVSDYVKKFDPVDKESSDFEVAIVGAGPAGATCAYFLGMSGRKTLLLEKKKFPRDKYCGDAVCNRAIEILDKMGIYQQLLDDNKAKIAHVGGMVSPGGLSYVGCNIRETPGVIVIKRTLLDEAIAMAAKKAGADLREDCPVKDALLDKITAMWTVTLDDDTTFRARVLVCADGATSKLATQLGIVTTPPTCQCSRAFVEGGTHRCKADAIFFWNPEVLPGYATLIKHPNDELVYCVYLVPGNPKVAPDDLPQWHDKMLKDPFISKALGNDFKIERMKAASLRVGGVPRSFDDHVLLLGDAAGMIDPMTGEGIQHAMRGGRMAAKFIGECLDHGNFDAEVMSIWHDRWMDKFGSDFKWSMWMSQMSWRFPVLIDAVVAAAARKGDQFWARYSEIMTGRLPKMHLLRPEFQIVITYELIVLMLKRFFGRSVTTSPKNQ